MPKETQVTAGTEGEVVTIAVDLTGHDPNVTVVTTVVTGHGTVVVTFDPHGMH